MKVEFRGVENLRRQHGCIIAAKHQSAWETIALVTQVDDFTYILKRELIFIPLFGQYLKLERPDRDRPQEPQQPRCRESHPAGGRGDRRGTRDLHFSGRHPPPGGRAALYKTGLPTSTPPPGALRSGRPEFRPVLAAPHGAAPPRNRVGGIPPGHSRRAEASEFSRLLQDRIETATQQPDRGSARQGPGPRRQSGKKFGPRPPRRIDFTPVLFFLCLPHVSSSKDRT